LVKQNLKRRKKNVIYNYQFEDNIFDVSSISTVSDIPILN